MKRQYSAIVFALLLGGCAASDDSKSNSPTTPLGAVPAADEVTATAPTPEPEVTPVAVAEPKVQVVMAIASISSVQLNEDCPDPRAQLKPAAKKKPSASMGYALEPQAGGLARPRRQRKGKRRRRMRRPCSQSTLQLAFTGQKGGASVVTLKGVRLKSAEGKPLADLATRMPTFWNESSYQPWDGTIKPGADLKASYKLSVPDWSAVEAALGGSSRGKMFTLEVDIEILGNVTTVTSSQFKRSNTVISPKFERRMPQNVRT